MPNSPIPLDSTYEDHFTHEEFSLKKARKIIIRKLVTCFSWIEELSIGGGRAVTRVCNKGSSLSIFDKIYSCPWIMTGMSSREFLNHVIVGLREAERILNEET